VAFLIAKETILNFSELFTVSELHFY